jgi:uncharacterized protein
VKIRVRVGPSRIAGQGLFAEQDIRWGTKIIRYIGEQIPHEESARRLAAGNDYIFGLDERSALDGSTRKNTARFINHSCEPNCHTEQFGRLIWIVALRDIRVLIRYHFDYESAQIWRSKVLEMSKRDPLVQQPCQGCGDATWAE